MAVKYRNLITCVVLTLITCGFYGIYWAIMLAKEAVSVKDPSDNGLLEIILMLFLPFLGLFMTEKKLSEGCEARGIPHSDQSILYLILSLLGLTLVAWRMMQNDLNKIA